MSLYGEYDEQNIFARIIRGEAPCFKIYEDEDVLAFLDLFPQSLGHALVIPKKARARNLLEIDESALCTLAIATQRLSKAIVEELQPDGVQITQFNGAPSGQTVFHIHVHIIPRYENAELGRHAQGKADPAELESLAARIAGRLRT